MEFPSNITSDFAEQSFYGFRVDPITSSISVEVISGGTNAVILPQDGIIDPYDYKQWLWSRNALQFNWTTSGHLQVKII